MKVYGIFSGEYSDWSVHGYFIDKDLAERYCALKNQGENYYFDNYYVVEIDNIQDEVKGLENVKLKYIHEVVIDYNNNGYKMRDEPNRYVYYSGDSKCYPNKIRTYNSGWVAFCINSDSMEREKAEKIALDMFNEYKYLIYEYNGDKDLALRVLGDKHGYELEIR